ncbi:LysR family transcriptional regulator [Paracoccus sp. PAR01]|uniref:LysR family transcriptional regulator n=1 Tax=Paracoccus sp. PAR01 TaxID=2769282 RepID=UPI00177B9E6F|nr:LysR family transcriptional regulator [Paracoccus sp. PAR01]MBD9527617.1 LysR family transcriptional regulator [Paracoccus sp. PAR01]
MQQKSGLGRPSFTDIDLKLLRIFAEIVRCNGFSAAQISLGMSQATISQQMRHLEERLGLRLCERGRAGFYLTEQGRQVHGAMLDLFGAIESFGTAIGDVRGELTGRLNFGTVDAMVTNRALGLDRAIGAFHQSAPKVSLDIDIAPPQALAQGLLTRRYEVALLPVRDALPGLDSRRAFSERQFLYCGQKHPLFGRPDGGITDAELARQAFAGRTYMPDERICGIDFQWSAQTAHMEGTLTLLLSGAFIGFLPDHFAAIPAREGQLRAIAPERLYFDDIFHIAFSPGRRNRTALLLADLIARECDMAGA